MWGVVYRGPLLTAFHTKHHADAFKWFIIILLCQRKFSVSVLWQPNVLRNEIIFRNILTHALYFWSTIRHIYLGITFLTTSSGNEWQVRSEHYINNKVVIQTKPHLWALTQGIYVTSQNKTGTVTIYFNKYATLTCITKICLNIKCINFVFQLWQGLNKQWSDKQRSYVKYNST